MVAQYQFDFGLRPSVAYLQSKGKDTENGYGDRDLLKYVDVGATYYFNKNMSTYVDYKINRLMRTTSLAQQVSVLTISSRWVWFTSSNCSYSDKGANRPFFMLLGSYKYAVLVYSCRPA